MTVQAVGPVHVLIIDGADVDIQHANFCPKIDDGVSEFGCFIDRCVNWMGIEGSFPNGQLPPDGTYKIVGVIEEYHNNHMREYDYWIEVVDDAEAS